MNNNFRISFFLFLATLFLVACEKDEIMTYSDVDKVNIDYTSMGIIKDTIMVSYGFVNNQSEVINLNLLLMGYASDVDREVGIKITSEDGAKENVHYTLPSPVIMPKNHVNAVIPLTILRPDDLSIDGAKSFNLSVTDSKDLVAGIRTTLYVHISDEIPDVWVGDAKWFMNPVSSFFGECSKTKYLFVFQVLNVWDFSAWALFEIMGDAAKFNPAKRILKEQLALYELENGPLMDPVKGRVTFPD